MIIRGSAFACLVALLAHSTSLRADSSFGFSPQPEGEFALRIHDALMAQRFKVKLITPGWKENYDHFNKYLPIEFRPDTLRVRTDLSGIGRCGLDLRKTSETQIALDAQISLTRKIPLDLAYLSVFIPAEFAQQNGFFLPSTRAAVPFPLLKNGPMLFSGPVGSFAWTDGLGRTLKLVFPFRVRVDLHDQRHWGKPLFELRIHFPPIKNPGITRLPFLLETNPASLQTRPFIDKFGQCTLKDWPEKIRSEAQLHQDILDEEQFLKDLRPPNRDTYGGWAGSGEKFQIRATGFFCTQKIRNRWWLVDPLGNLFFSLGTFFAYCDTYTDPRDREELFEWLPAPEGAWKSTWLNFSDNPCFSFYKANLIRKYGKTWGRDWYETSVKRWTAWGFNTTSAFGGRLRKIPYANGPYYFVDQCAPAIPGASPDVFDPAFGVKLDDLCRKRLGRLKSDPLFLGYFFGNEQPFHKIPELVPQLPSTFAAKRALVDLLTQRYSTIGEFNRAWQMNVKSFADLAGLKLKPGTPQAERDMDAFLVLYCDTYGLTLRDTVKRYDPNHLILGFRWTPITVKNKMIVRTLGKYLDVVSVNYYTATTIAPDFISEISALAGDKPVLLSEWSYGTPERGHTGGIHNVNTQAERGRFYARYVRDAVKHPAVVGAHWYEYVDQAVTGRYVGGDRAERCNAGLVDIADHPYYDFLGLVIKANHHIYKSITP